MSLKIGDWVRVSNGGQPLNYQGVGVVTAMPDLGYVYVRGTWDEHQGEEVFPFEASRVTKISDPLAPTTSDPWAGTLGGYGQRALEFRQDFQTGESAPSDPKTKDTNPKDAIASGKLPLHLWPKTASIGGALALLDGMLKYGRLNWREAGVKASVYVDALERHVTRWFEGEDVDPDSGLPHLWHALACLAILVDADAHGKIVDDRQYNGGFPGFDNLLAAATPLVEQLKEKHADKTPRHYTIADA